MNKLKPKAKWKEVRHPVRGAWYFWGDVKVHAAKEDGLWHMSISLPYRYPTWDEIHAAWYGLRPDAENISGAIILPADYVNIHPNCFHVHQLEDNEIPKGVIL